MSIRIATPVDIAVAGLRTESLRMNVIAANIANAETTQTASGTPYRRKDVVLTTTSGGLLNAGTANVVEDTSTDFKRVYQPGHPQADADGYVLMPNVELPTEMIHLVTASRAYQANAAVMKRYQEMSDQTLELLK